MLLLDRLQQLVSERPPELAFEISDFGVAYAKPLVSSQISFHPLEPDVLSISPLRDNVLRPEALASAVQAITGPASPRKRKPALLILPDFCARVTVLEFDSFPTDPREQNSLVRFRMKKTVPFDLDACAVAYHPQQGAAAAKKIHVVAVAASLEIVAKYEAPFRTAGLQLGVVTTSALAAVDLDRHRDTPGGITLMAKLAGRVLTVSVLDSGTLKLLRCIELAEINQQELIGVLFPTVAYVEDELGARPSRLSLCGFADLAEQHRLHWETELGLSVDTVQSQLGVPEQFNAGLHGYLESLGTAKSAAKSATSARKTA